MYISSLASILEREISEKLREKITFSFEEQLLITIDHQLYPLQSIEFIYFLLRRLTSGITTNAVRVAAMTKLIQKSQRRKVK